MGHPNLYNVFIQTGKRKSNRRNTNNSSVVKTILSSKPKRDTCEYKKTEDLLKESQEELISSVEASQEISQNFMNDTLLNDETPMCDDKMKRSKKSWVKQLNNKLENIEAVACKSQVCLVIKKSFYTTLIQLL